MRDYLSATVNGFFAFFFIIYIGKFGLTNFIWTGILNIGIWYLLTMFCLKNFLDDIEVTQSKSKAKVKV